MKQNKYLPMDAGGCFKDVYLWTVINLAYWRCNLYDDRRFILRFNYLQTHTPIKNQSTLAATFKELTKQPFVTARPFGKPQLRKCGKGRTETKMVQSYEYVFDANAFDKWFDSFLKCSYESLMEKHCSDWLQKPIQNRIDHLSKFGKLPIQNRIATYLNLDSTVSPVRTVDRTLETVQGKTAQTLEDFEVMFGKQ